MNKNNILIILTLCVSAFCFGACQTKKESVKVLNSFGFGVIVAQNPLTFTPEVRLGYNEFGMVAVEDNYTENKLINAAVEVQYRKNSADGQSKGLFQKVVIGKTAVQQPFTSKDSFKK